MAINEPPNREPTSFPDGTLRLSWMTWFTQVYRALTGNGGPLPLQSYTKAALPDAAKNAGAMIYVSDEAGGAVPAFSDGSAWKRVTDRNTVS